MDLIVTHIGADFDAFASVLAAGRLHEGARVFFPGSKEESVRLMLESGFAEVEELRQREIDPAAVERVILVDIRQPDRIGVVAEWFAARPDLPRVIYDHHTPADGDLEADGGIIDPSVGATATLLAEEMGRRGLPVSPREATILLMGIYEDTGSLTYPTVSPRDLAAVAWLLERGGDLAAKAAACLVRSSRNLVMDHAPLVLASPHRCHSVCVRAGSVRPAAASTPRHNQL